MALSPPPSLPPLSAVSSEIAASKPASDDTALPSHDRASSSASSPSSLHTSVALQVQRNLRHQHNWTDLCLHTHSPLAPSQALPRPVLSGLPPARLYVHPDQQAAEIAAAQAKDKQQKQQAQQSGWNASSSEATGEAAEDVDNDEDEDHAIEHEWVLPTQIREKWSLRKFAEVFDALGDVMPPGASSSSAEQATERSTQRILLAMLSDDSTINYYIMHDGVVKPRQN